MRIAFLFCLLSTLTGCIFTEKALDQAEPAGRDMHAGGDDGGVRKDMAVPSGDLDMPALDMGAPGCDLVCPAGQKCEESMCVCKTFARSGVMSNITKRTPFRAVSYQAAEPAQAAYAVAALGSKSGEQNVSLELVDSQGKALAGFSKTIEAAKLLGPINLVKPPETDIRFVQLELISGPKSIEIFLAFEALKTESDTSDNGFFGIVSVALIPNSDPSLPAGAWSMEAPKMWGYNAELSITAPILWDAAYNKRIDKPILVVGLPTSNGRQWNLQIYEVLAEPEIVAFDLKTAIQQNVGKETPFFHADLRQIDLQASDMIFSFDSRLKERNLAALLFTKAQGKKFESKSKYISPAQPGWFEHGIDPLYTPFPPLLRFEENREEMVTILGIKQPQASNKGPIQFYTTLNQNGDDNVMDRAATLQDNETNDVSLTAFSVAPWALLSGTTRYPVAWTSRQTSPVPFSSLHVATVEDPSTGLQASNQTRLASDDYGNDPEGPWLHVELVGSPIPSESMMLFAQKDREVFAYPLSRDGLPLCVAE